MKNLLNLQKVILPGLIIINLYGCMPPLYFPNGINAPLLSKKGQFAMNVGTDGSCTDIQFAGSPTDKLGIMLNINFADFTNQSTSSTSYNSSYGGGSSYSTTTSGHSHSFFEGGMGYYKKLGNHGRTETFGLIGIGSAESYSSGNKKSADYIRVAIQSDIGIETKAFEGIFSCRLGYLSLNADHSGDTNGSSNNYYSDPSSPFIDPAITLRLGWQGFKFTTQYGLSIPFNGSSNDWNPGWWTIGIQMRFQ